LAPPDDPVAFADAIEKLAQNKELRERMGINSLNRVCEKFDVDLDVRNTIEIYDGLR
jgi:glycosyltransferase involved in cell wall biosynthesis